MNVIKRRQGLQTTIRASVGSFVLSAAAAMVVVAPGAYADDSSQVRVSSLEVKARIASMEEVNVTAEKPIDASAPAPSLVVAELLEELEAIEAQIVTEPVEE